MNVLRDKYISLFTVATLKRFFTRSSRRLGTAMIVTRAGVSLISGSQYDMTLSPGDHEKSLKIDNTINTPQKSYNLLRLFSMMVAWFCT